ncbi:uncharacterized protein N7515_005922 [Penicillium bovifimosum]|uniref:Uncharacterized protein n=1 Tax=Penicillium bovifimosum TaxID=126998 RepID=A0A9W9GU03_9EURO|nr:uncharacterized protein N7515_005922 [Penicillium bovifimosum]KAJ5129883.1 hypothetical protein N7515_005922 [Penicillium bovifimosum]
MSQTHGEDSHPEELVQNMPARRNSSRLFPRGLRTLPPPFVPHSQRHLVHPPGLAPSRIPSASMDSQCVVQPQSQTPGLYHGYQYLDTQPIGPTPLVYSSSPHLAPRQLGYAAYGTDIGASQHGTSQYGATQYGATQYGAGQYPILTQQTRTAQVDAPPIRAPQARAPKVELSQIGTCELDFNAMVPRLWTPDPESPDSLAPSPPPAKPTHDLRPPLPSAPPIGPQYTSPPLPTVPVPCGVSPSWSVGPQHVVPAAPPGLAATHPTTIDPHNIYQTATRPCHIAHRRYTDWTRVAYGASILPETFLTRWHEALGEVRLVFGYSTLPDIIVFNQFLSAVSANPAAREWVASLHVPMDRPLAASVMEETYRDFLKHEARRLGHPPSTWDPQPAKTKAPPAEGGLKYYCPIHHILTKHSMEDCPLLPRNSSAKQTERMDKSKKDGRKKGGSHQKDRKKR